MKVFRLGTEKFPVWNGNGAAAFGGRWNPSGVPVIYAAATLSLAMLERLAQRRNLGRTLMVEADLPPDLVIENLFEQPPPDWRALSSPAAAAAGGAWVASRRTALLRVPSALEPRESNFVINPGHPDAGRIHVSAPQILEWDARPFGVPPPS